MEPSSYLRRTLREPAADLWQELRESAAPRRAAPRRVLVVVLLIATAWFGAHALHDSLWSYRYWKVDPWALESPVQWPVVGRHARSMDRLSTELSCLRPGDKVAVQGPSTWQGQEHYLFMWLAFSLPEQDVIPVVETRDIEQAGSLLVYFGDTQPPESPPLGMVEACRTERAAVFSRQSPSRHSALEATRVIEGNAP